MLDDKLRKFYERESNEIRQNKLRFGAIATSLVISLAILGFTSEDTETAPNSDEESLKVVSAANYETSAKDKSVEKPTSKVTTVAGLKKASDTNNLLNPFKVDSDMSQTNQIKPPEVIPLPPQPEQDKISEPSEKIVLTLKGTATSGDKKMAIIQRNVGEDNSKSKDKSKNESLLLNVGDEINGQRIVNIGKDFVVFDDGHEIHIQETL